MGVEVTESITSETAFRGGYKNAAVMEDRKILYRDFAAFWLMNEFRRRYKGAFLQLSGDDESGICSRS